MNLCLANKLLNFLLDVWGFLAKFTFIPILLLKTI